MTPVKARCRLRAGPNEKNKGGSVVESELCAPRCAARTADGAHIGASAGAQPPLMRQEASIAEPLAAAPPQTKPTARAWFVLAVLCFVYVLNFLDRQLLSILAKPIQDTLHITDGQLGLIGGLYFALFYCFIAIPVGWLADRTNRVEVLSLACGDLERGDDGVRVGRQLSATGHRAHDGGLR